jgi:hypothetical protein
LYSHDPLRFKLGEFVDQVWRLKPDDAMSVIVEDDENKITAGIGIMTSNLPDLGMQAVFPNSRMPGTNNIDP